MVKNLGIKYKKPELKAYFLGNEVAEVREFESNGYCRIIMKDSNNVFEVPMSMVTLRVR